MIPLFLYLAAAFGLAFGLGHSELTFNFRLALYGSSVKKWLLKLLECPACLGFHTGWLWIALGGRHFFGAESTVTEALVLGFATCGVNLVLAKVSGLSDPA